MHDRNGSIGREEPHTTCNVPVTVNQDQNISIFGLPPKNGNTSTSLYTGLQYKYYTQDLAIRIYHVY